MALNEGKWDADDFPWLIPLVKAALRDYLKAGSDTVPGLDTRPMFLVKEGTGFEGDEPVYKPADVIFSDDSYEGNNYVRITVHGGDWITPQRGTTIIPLRFLLDSASTAEVGALTEGADPYSADDVLSGYVLRLLSTFEAYQELSARGLHNMAVRVEREMRNDKTGISNNPVSMLCNVWVRGSDG